MSYQVAVASSIGDDATMANSFIIALEGPTLTWYTRLLLSAFRDRGVPKPMSECAACPSPDGSSAWASAKGGSEVARDGRERGGNPAAFVFVPRPGRVRLQ
jgi:hypothetical protein